MKYDESTQCAACRFQPDSRMQFSILLALYHAIFPFAIWLCSKALQPYFRFFFVSLFLASFQFSSTSIWKTKTLLNAYTQAQTHTQNDNSNRQQKLYLNSEYLFGHKNRSLVQYSTLTKWVGLHSYMSIAIYQGLFELIDNEAQGRLTLMLKWNFKYNAHSVTR